MSIEGVAVPFQKSTNVRTSFVARAIGIGLEAVNLAAPQTAARLAANLFLTPRRIKRPQREVDWLASAKRTDFQIGGRRIATWERGSGETVLLIHGWEGRGAQLGSFFDGEHNFVAVDLPAHGESEGKRTNVFECAGVIRELIDRLRPTALIAHSFGCAATTIALRDLTVHPRGGGFPARPTIVDAERPLAGLEARPPLRIVFVAPPEDFNFFTDSFGAALGISDDLAARMQREIETRFDTDWELVRGAAIAPSMTAPLLVVHDEGDYEVPFRYGYALAAEWPGAQLMKTKGLGHRRILRDPYVIDTARRFVDGLSPRQPEEGEPLATRFTPPASDLSRPARDPGKAEGWRTATVLIRDR